MKRILFILTLFFAVTPLWQCAVANGTEDKVVSELKATEKAAEEEKPNLKEVIFDHLGDGYGWEVPFNHHKRIPLPVIVWGKDGLHVFSSSRVTH